MTCHKFYDRKPNIFVSLFYSKFFVCVSLSLSPLFVFCFYSWRTYVRRKKYQTHVCLRVSILQKKNNLLCYTDVLAQGEKEYIKPSVVRKQEKTKTKPNSTGGKNSKRLFINKKKKQAEKNKKKQEKQKKTKK